LLDVRAEKQRLADRLEVLQADARQYQDELRLSQENLEKARADYRKLQSKMGGHLSAHAAVDAEGRLDACSAAAAQTCARAEDRSSQLAEQHEKDLETVEALKLEIAALRVSTRSARDANDATGIEEIIGGRHDHLQQFEELSRAREEDKAAWLAEKQQLHIEAAALREQLQERTKLFKDALCSLDAKGIELQTLRQQVDEIDSLKTQLEASQAQVVWLRQGLARQQGHHEEALRPASGGKERAYEVAGGAQRACSRAGVAGAGGCRGRGTTNPFDEPVPSDVCEHGDCAGRGGGGDEEAQMHAERELQAARETVRTQQLALDALRQELEQSRQAQPPSEAPRAQNCGNSGNGDADTNGNEDSEGAIQGRGEADNGAACAATVGVNDSRSDAIEAQFGLEAARARAEELAGEVRKLERTLNEGVVERAQVEKERDVLREELAMLRQELERAAAEHMDLEKIGRFLEQVNLKLMRRVRELETSHDRSASASGWQRLGDAMAEQDTQRASSPGKSQGSPLGFPLSFGHRSSTMLLGKLAAGRASPKRTGSGGDDTPPPSPIRARGAQRSERAADQDGKAGGPVPCWHDPLKMLVQRISDGVPAPLDAYVEGILIEAAGVLPSAPVPHAAYDAVDDGVDEEGTGGDRTQKMEMGEHGSGECWLGGDTRRQDAGTRGVELLMEGHFVMTLAAIVMDNPKLQREWRGGRGGMWMVCGGGGWRHVCSVCLGDMYVCLYICVYVYVYVHVYAYVYVYVYVFMYVCMCVCVCG